MTAIRRDRWAVLSLVLALIPACVTQFAAFWIAASLLRRTAADPAPAAEDRGIAVVAQTCSVFMIPVTGMVAIVLAIVLFPWLQRRQLQVQETAILEALAGIHAAQMEWRRRDLDGNGVSDYAVDGLRLLHDAVGPDGSPAALVPREVAEADAGHGDARPHRGYWFRALDHDHAGIPYRSRAALAFGVVAYPAEERVVPGKTFVINETGAIWERELSGPPPNEWPALDPATQGWRPVR